MATAPVPPSPGDRGRQRSGFASVKDRQRLSTTALEAFRTLSHRWHLNDAEAAALLGVDDHTWSIIERGVCDDVLSQDQLTRVSIAVSIYSCLHLLFADGMADRWLRLPNSGVLFGDLTPIESMVEGGIPKMLDTRRHLDGVRNPM